MSSSARELSLENDRSRAEKEPLTSDLHVCCSIAEFFKASRKTTSQRRRIPRSPKESTRSESKMLNIIRTFSSTPPRSSTDVPAKSSANDNRPDPKRSNRWKSSLQQRSTGKPLEKGRRTALNVSKSQPSLPSQTLLNSSCIFSSSCAVKWDACTSCCKVDVLGSAWPKKVGSTKRFFSKRSSSWSTSASIFRAISLTQARNAWSSFSGRWRATFKMSWYTACTRSSS
mmetsp:Transcript_27343/g.63057  ORF Transcript_27343/g.63057 Transcript_27343/m.63057 type:complete len:228 (+) Transcript_27343:728-1411(+)